MSLTVLVIGGGGREHALAWCAAKSASVSHVYAAPGNPGIATLGTCVQPRAANPAAFLEIAESVSADLTIVGPEVPLVAGVVDLFRARGRRIFGPAAAAAQLEGSKVFAKDLMAEAGIPTARFSVATDLDTARSHLRQFDLPVVLKADGLAAGKGVVIARTQGEADQTLRALFSGELVGAAGSRVVIEEFLAGEEVSFIALCHNTRAVAFEPSQDHKTIHDGDQGPNTGGMGAYSDSLILDTAARERVMTHVIRPTLDHMAHRGSPFTGFLYAGLMMTAAGPRVLEFNVRLGDPEAQALLYRMDGDFIALIDAAERGELPDRPIAQRMPAAVCVVAAASGYPARARSGDVINGIGDAEARGATVFHAGTKAATSGLLTSGGRVLGITAGGDTLLTAINGAYRGVEAIRFDGMQYRRDIGRKGLKRWQTSHGA